ncbi:MAG: undecaprenyl-phosphate glucose phosphotransferase [Lacipirellulaceae bacterium]
MSTIQRGIRPAHSLLSSLHRLVDAAAIAAVAYAAARLTPVGGGAGMSLVNEWIGVSAAAAVVFHALAEATGLYRSWRGARLRGELACIASTWAYTVATLLGLGLALGYNARFSYETKLAWIVGTPLAMSALRVVLRLVQRRLQAAGYNLRRVVIVGVNELGVQLARNLAASPDLGLKLVGFYDDRYGDRRQRGERAEGSSTRKVELPTDLASFAGGIDELVAAARSGEIDSVYLTFPMRAEARLKAVLARLADTTADVYIVPDFFVFELLHARLTNVGGLPAVSIHENPLYGVDGLVKRAADLVLGSLILLMLAVPMLVVALAVKLTSKGPVFFRQKRYGLDGREILVWKFRSMRTEQCSAGDAGTVVNQATKGDSRITSVGAFLRKSSLDELPQLFNVLGGSMSLVGPRPHASAHNEQYRTLIDGYMLRHKVKPGITGLAQVMGFRGETDTLDKMEGRVAYDHEYIRTWSLAMDLEILARTVLVVLKRENAY